MSDRIVGTCSKCGGTVCTPIVWAGTTPPIPKCDTCGAVKKNSLPVIETEYVEDSSSDGSSTKKFLRD